MGFWSTIKRALGIAAEVAPMVATGIMVANVVVRNRRPGDPGPDQIPPWPAFLDDIQPGMGQYTRNHIAHAIRLAADGRGWQDISTAPDTGEVFWAFGPVAEAVADVSIYRARWSARLGGWARESASGVFDAPVNPVAWYLQ
jgi:hypothetical protein